MKFSHDQAIEESGWLGKVIELGQAFEGSNYSNGCDTVFLIIRKAVL